MFGIPGTPGTHGPMPDPPQCYCSVSVCVTGLIQSGQAKKRSRLSSSDTFTRRQGPTCACLFHEESDFICAHTPSAGRNLFTPHLSSPEPPLPRIHCSPIGASWKSPNTTGSGRSLPVHDDNHHPAAQSALICPVTPTVSILTEGEKTRTLSKVTNVQKQCWSRGEWFNNSSPKCTASGCENLSVHSVFDLSERHCSGDVPQVTFLDGVLGQTKASSPLSGEQRSHNQ